MNKCINCKFYEYDYDRVIGQCSRWKLGGDFTDLDIDDVIVDVGDGGYGVWMRPEFGCVLWEAH
jgi:hypothetical protein